MLQLFQNLIQSHSLDELHDVVGQAIVFADAEDRHNVGVVQLGRRLGLALETPPLRVIDEYLARQHFEGDVASQRDLLGLIDDAHAAAADFAQNAKIAQLLRRRMSRRRRLACRIAGQRFIGQGDVLHQRHGRKHFLDLGRQFGMTVDVFP